MIINKILFILAGFTVYAVLYIYWRITTFFRCRNQYFNGTETYYVNPNKIIYFHYYEPPFILWKDSGKIMDGFWDQKKILFKEHFVYRALKKRFIDNLQWEDTYYYHYILNMISNGKMMWWCKNKLEWDNRLSELDKIFYDVKRDGYKSNRKIYKKINNFNMMKAQDEVLVNIGRNGDLIFNDGQHRLAIAMLLDIKKIPIKVVIRHTKWVNFVNDIKKNIHNEEYFKKMKKELLKYKFHIDLKEIMNKI